jgi:hypothetical protein
MALIRSDGSVIHPSVVVPTLPAERGLASLQYRTQVDYPQAVSIAEFGISIGAPTGTGVTDDSAAFNQACTALFGSGLALYVGPGTYLCNSPIVNQGVSFIVAAGATFTGSSAPNLTRSFLQRGADYSSLCNGDIGTLRWQAAEPSLVPSFALNVALGPDGYQDATDTNFTLTGGGSIFSTVVDIPAGVTKVTFSVPFALPSGAVANNDVAIVVTDYPITQVFGQTFAVPAAAWQTLSLTLTLTPGATYLMRLVSNTNGFGYPASGTQRVLWGRPSITPVTSTDTFWTSPFLRLHLTARDWQDNPHFAGTGMGGGLLYQRYDYVAPSSRVQFRTDAQTIFLEVVDFSDTNQQYLTIIVDGRVFQSIVGTALASLSTRFLKVTGLPSGMKVLEILTSSQIIFPSFSLQNVYGIFVNAVYFPTSANVTRVPPRVPTDTIVWTGTSKDAGFATTQTTIQGVIEPLRNELAYQSIVSLAIGGKSLNWAYTIGSNSIQPYAATIINARPSHVFLNDMRNDWQGPALNSPWGGAAGADQTAWAAQMQNLITAIHTALPACQMWLLYTTHETTEGANNNGSTLANYYSGLDTLFTNNAAFTVPPKKCDLRGLWASGAAATWTVDGTHPTPQGYGLIVQFIRGLLGR